MSKLSSILLSKIRNKDLSRTDFRKNALDLCLCLAQQTCEFLHTHPIQVQTPCGQAQGDAFTNHLLLVPILRSGLVMLPAFIEYFPEALIGCIGLRQDEKTAIANLYYQNIPKLSGHEQVIMLDPMIATGDSAQAALTTITKLGIPQTQIIFVGIIASQDGIRAVQETFPSIKILVATIDKELNDKKFIVPGLGDFGDRFFGTE